MKRDIQGKFTLKNDDYRYVRALRLTELTWKTLGIAAECLGLTRADLVELRVREDSSAWIVEQTEEKQDVDASLLKLQEEIKLLQTKIQNLSKENTVLKAQVLSKDELSAKQQQVLDRLKLGKQSHDYKLAEKVLKQLVQQATAHLPSS